jgi:hypothetical protein
VLIAITASSRETHFVSKVETLMKRSEIDCSRDCGSSSQVRKFVIQLHSTKVPFFEFEGMIAAQVLKFVIQPLSTQGAIFPV